MSFDLRDEAGCGSCFHTSVPVDVVLSSDGYTPPVARLEGVRERRYRLVVAMPGASPGAGIGLVANRESTYPDGALFVGGREQWGDLVFRTSAARPTVYSNIDIFLRHRRPLAASRWFLLALLLVYDVALSAFVCRLFSTDH